MASYYELTEDQVNLITRALDYYGANQIKEQKLTRDDYWKIQNLIEEFQGV